MKRIYSIIVLFAGTLFSANSFAQAKVTEQQAGATTHAPETQVSKFDIQIQGKGVPDMATVYVRYITGKKLTLAPVHFKKGKAEYKAMITEPTLIMLFLARDGGSFNSRSRTIPIEKLSFYADPREKAPRSVLRGILRRLRSFPVRWKRRSSSIQRILNPMTRPWRHCMLSGESYMSREQWVKRNLAR